MMCVVCLSISLAAKIIQFESTHAPAAHMLQVCAVIYLSLSAVLASFFTPNFSH